MSFLARSALCRACLHGKLPLCRPACCSLPAPPPQVKSAVAAAGGKLELHWGNTMYHLDDLPFRWVTGSLQVWQCPNRQKAVAAWPTTDHSPWHGALSFLCGLPAATHAPCPWPPRGREDLSDLPDVFTPFKQKVGWVQLALFSTSGVAGHGRQWGAWYGAWRTRKRE